MKKRINRKFLLLMVALITTLSGAFAQKTGVKMKDNENRTALEVYDIMKASGKTKRSCADSPRVNISGYAVKVGPDVYGLPSVEISETKGGKARTLCVLPFMDYLKLRHVSKGDKVVFNGEVRGYSSEYDIVVVKESKIVSVNDKKP